jgi:signal transduction histidine kinase
MARAHPHRQVGDMLNPAQDWLAPHPLWDQILRLTPVHVFVVDTALVCRYAAPVDDAFLGQPRDQLLHRHVAEFFPPAANGLRMPLERAVREGVPWRMSRFRYAHRSGDAEVVHIWNVHAGPLQLDQHRGALLTLADVLDLAEQIERFQRERDALHGALEQLRRTHAERDRVLTATAVHLRTLLTPIWGYLQLLLRVPDLREPDELQPLLTNALLPQVQELLEALRGLEYLPSAEPEEPA